MALPREGDHNRALKAAAEKVLTPLGFWRKGRSRVWLADRGFWLSIVEFQPSGYSKGSYLNVAAHWLWSPEPDVLSFDYCVERQKPWIAFESAAQFEPLADHLVRQAAEESRQLSAEITDIPTLASLLTAKHAASAAAGQGGGWPAFHASIASGLSGDLAAARVLFGIAYRSIGAWSPDLQTLLAPYADAFDKQSSFTKFIAQRIDEQRSGRGLSPLSPAMNRAMGDK